jgi:hypothetical protein
VPAFAGPSQGNDWNDNVARTTTDDRDCLGFLHYDAPVGGWTFAAEGIRGDLAGLTPRLAYVPDALGDATVVFRVGGGPAAASAAVRRAVVHARALLLRTVRVP